MNPAIGIGLKVLSAFAFTLMSAGIKSMGGIYPTGQIVFFRSFFAILPLLLWLGWQGHLLDSIKTSDLRGHVVRGLIGSAGMFSGFVTLSYLPLPDAVAIGYVSPLVTVVFAFLLLRERVRVYRWSAVAAGFAGVLVMLSPHLRLGGVAAGASTLDGAAIGAGFGLVGACCAAGATIQVRRLTATEKTGAIVLYFSLLTTLLGLATIVFGWVTPSPFDLGRLVLIGVLGGIGQILMTQSYRYAEASLVAPFDYITMVWALMIGWFAFGDLPGPEIVVGGLIVIAAGLFVIWREHRLGLVRAKHVETGAQRGT